MAKYYKACGIDGRTGETNRSKQYLTGVTIIHALDIEYRRMYIRDVKVVSDYFI